MSQIKLEKNIKKPHKITVVSDGTLQCSKGNKVAYQTTKMYKKCHLFFYLYNTPILLKIKKLKTQTIF
jgi:hypothetical protein